MGQPSVRACSVGSVLFGTCRSPWLCQTVEDWLTGSAVTAPTFKVMSVKHAISRGLELGRSVLQLGLFKSGGRVVAKLRADCFRVGPSGRTVQPQAFLPSRYRYYRTSLKGLAAQLQSAVFRRRFTGGSPRNRAVFLAFGLGVGLIEQQLEEDRKSAATCQEIQVEIQ